MGGGARREVCVMGLNIRRSRIVVMGTKRVRLRFVHV